MDYMGVIRQQKELTGPYNTYAIIMNLAYPYKRETKNRAALINFLDDLMHRLMLSIQLKKITMQPLSFVNNPVRATLIIMTKATLTYEYIATLIPLQVQYKTEFSVLKVHLLKNLYKYSWKINPKHHVFTRKKQTSKSNRQENARY